ncbi:methyl-accepting chemotaxis protein [Flexithrix dorotheae]|uniref:methyl-accepting chemotaxis protein n=1 Tax=Flexithrix dorotheae TaxID=70993 RepID=UPI000375E2E9|nr:PAS domain-containing protein [Flexithrix dorotheae]
MENTVKRSRTRNAQTKNSGKEKDDLFLEMSAQINAINAAFALITFDLKGNILSANDTFLETMGYSLEEIEGKPHSIFVNPSYAKSIEYKNFWNDLKAGQPKSGEFKRFAKGKKVIWLQASYSPVTDQNGDIVKVVKLASDITAQKLISADYGSQVDAIQKSNAVIEFNLDGTIISANQNFLNAFGYKLSEIEGKHHRMFCDRETINSPEYKAFWESLNQGVFDSGEYLRLGKGGKEIWIQASYNPVFNLEGEPYKVVKYATDITRQKEIEKDTQAMNENLRATEEELRQNMEEMKATQEEMERRQTEINGQMAAINSTSAFIEFDINGNIQNANDIFLNAVGYTLNEIQGEHHRIFCEEGYAQSGEYQRFWKKLSQGFPQTGEFKRFKKSGEELWLNANYTPVKDKDGKVVKVIKLANDITVAKLEQLDVNGKISAINQSNAVIEFTPDGHILNANDNFLTLTGYDFSEIEGEHHEIFCEEKYVKSQAYKNFWKALKNGEFQGGEFKRFTKKGDSFWIQGTYNPISDLNGKVIKVVKIASDITSRKKLEFEAHKSAENLKAQEEELRQNMEEMHATQEEMAKRQVEMDGQMAAINSTSAFIEFNMDGTVVRANDNFLSAMKYSIDEITGKHHQMFCDPDFIRTAEYLNFWNDLRNGKPQSGEFKRVDKNGEEVWMMANYTPVFDQAGKPARVIKLATDITESKLKNANYEGQLKAVNISYGVIEFNLDGTVIEANDNFLNLIGYDLDEIKGKHHRMFCENEYANSYEYKAFWEALNRGEFNSGTFKRLGRNGKEIFIQATYNPIFDLEGKPYKVVKYATDITEFTVALNAVSEFVSELKQGNFEAQLDLKAEGNVGKMIEDNISLRNTLKEIVGEINRVVKKAGDEGDLNTRLNLEDAEGTWKDLVESLNSLLQSIAEPVLEFNSIISEMAKGDLTHQFRMAAKGDIKNMADSLNTAIANLNQLLGKIGNTAEEVSGSSEQVLSKSEVINRSTSEVSTAISQMAQGAQDQAAKTDASSRLVNQVKLSANEMEHKASIINKTAENGKKKSEEGLRTIKDLVENMSNISTSAGLTSDSINVLTQRAEEIGRTLNVITDIAAQTNLLALNAAIEAARAGDAGRGFAVVADEIRKLAENSRKSAVEIEKIISDVQKDTISAGKAIETMGLNVDNGNKATREAEEIFVEISKSSEYTFSYSEEIKNATALQKKSIDSVVTNIEQIVVVAEQTAAGSQQVAGSAQQLNINMDEITASSTRLSEIAADLKEGINQFKLSGE